MKEILNHDTISLSSRNQNEVIAYNCSELTELFKYENRFAKFCFLSAIMSSQSMGYLIIYYNISPK